MMPCASLLTASANGLSTETNGGSRSDAKYAILSLIGSATVAIGNSANTIITQRAMALVIDFPILLQSLLKSLRVPDPERPSWRCRRWKLRIIPIGLLTYGARWSAAPQLPWAQALYYRRLQETRRSRRCDAVPCLRPCCRQ